MATEITVVLDVRQVKAKVPGSCKGCIFKKAPNTEPCPKNEAGYTRCLVTDTIFKFKK